MISKKDDFKDTHIKTDCDETFQRQNLKKNERGELPYTRNYK